MVDRRPCEFCKKEFSVTSKGVMRKHTQSTWRGGSNYEVVECAGSGKAPRGLDVPQPVALANPPRNVVRGAMDSQRRAYAKLGLKWPPPPPKKKA